MPGLPLTRQDRETCVRAFGEEQTRPQCCVPLQDFVLTSSIFEASPVARYFHFYFHMLGIDMGSLHVESLGNAGWTQLWSRTGAQGSQWVLALVSLPQDAMSVRFVGTTGDDFESDMAVDGIAAGLPTVEDFRQFSCDFRFDTCLWINTGTASWQHVAGPGEHDRWLEVAGNGSQAQQCTLETAAVFNTTETKILLFAYQVFGSSSTTLAVEYETSADDWHTLWLNSSDQSGVWQQAAVLVPVSTTGLRLSGNVANASDVVRVKSLQASYLQQFGDIACGFEADLCSWSSNGEHQWLRNSGPTPSSSTGPEQAAEGTWYVYIDAWSAFDKAGP